MSEHYQKTKNITFIFRTAKCHKNCQNLYTKDTLTLNMNEIFHMFADCIIFEQ